MTLLEDPASAGADDPALAGQSGVMEKSPRLSHATLKVLHMFMDNPARGLAGSDIGKETKVWSGTLYPMLARLEKVGWLTSEWEAVDASRLGRPRKRIYRITAVGQRAAYEALAPLELVGESRSWMTS
jgi:PadR family transcriptional regulator